MQPTKKGPWSGPKGSEFFRNAKRREDSHGSSRKQSSSPWELELDRLFTPDETLRILRTAEESLGLALEQGRAVRARDAWLALIALHAGLRVSEIANVRVGDVVSAEPAAVVVRRGKGGKRRVVVVSQELRGHLERFIAFKRERGEPVDPDAPLFLSSNTGRALTPRALQLAFARLLVRASVPHRGIHSCRHTFASSLCKASKSNLRLVQRQLGHSSLAVTQVYLGVLASDVQDAVEALYPRSTPKRKDARP